MVEEDITAGRGSGDFREDRHNMLYRFHDYTLDPASREVRHGARRLALEPKVFQVLLYLLEHRDRMVPKAELFEQCWPETFVSESALTRCLTRLRRAVQPSPTAPLVIETRHRQGYRFVAEVTVLAQAPPASGDPAPLRAATPAVPPVSSDSPEPPTPRHSASLSTSSTRPTVPEAERRQLTVLFCDVVDSTTLAGQLDPEDYRDIMGRYHATCTAVIQRYGGHVAQYLGDGLLVYFGWPQAHEDDARRAVHAGLALVTAVRELGSELVQDFGIHLAVRVGIHTGLVVVGTGAEDTPYGQLAVGATPNLAAKIQALAAPDAVVISAATQHLVQGYFVCASLGEHHLPGTTEPGALYQVRGTSGAQGRLDVIPPLQRTPFVGREVELAVLRERATQVQQGRGQVVLLSGEAGIGKSRLVQEVTTALASDGFTCLECRCSPYAQHTALHPVIEWLQRCIQDDAGTPVSERLARLEDFLQQVRLDLPESLPLVAAFLSLPLPEARYPALHLTPQRQRQRTLETLVALLLGLAERQPVLLVVEDLDWRDPTTLEWLGLVIDQGPTAPIFTLLTCRPTFASPWGGRTHVTLLPVHRLASPQVTQMVQWLGEDRLSAAQRQHIVTQTDGIPLFVEEVTKFVLAVHRLHGHTDQQGSASAGSAVRIPVTLQDSLMARLDQLGAAKSTAQLGATIGREFPAALLQAVTPLDEDIVRQDLKQLVDAELLYQRGVGATAMYQFKHALIQDAAYASLLRKTRQHYHQHIAQVLEAQFPEVAETQPELLARHYTEAGLNEPAVDYWQRAGQRAIEHSAHVEAIGHFTRGLEVLRRLPETPVRAQQELSLQLALGAPLIATKGYAAPEVEHVYSRARELCQQLGETPEVFRALWGLRTVHYLRSELRMAMEYGRELLHIAQRQQDVGFLVEAHRSLGTTLCNLGDILAARTHLGQALALYDSQQHRSHVFLYGQDPGMACLSYDATALWLLGHSQQALQRSQVALTLAENISHPYSLAFALNMVARLHQFRREAPMTLERVETSITLSTEQGFAQFLSLGMILRGWALVTQKQEEESITLIRQGMAAFQATGAELFQTYSLALLAEAYMLTGQAEDGLRALREALVLVDKNDERFYEAEIHRLKGELLLALSPDHQAEAETCFYQALAVARRQQAKSLELRAAISLTRLWQRQGKRVEARKLLAPIYGWFTEGFDTADLQDAKALLEALR